jgi:hypothetical protein
MVDRLRALLDRPLDPSAARAILVFASAILFGVAALFALGGGEPDRPTSREDRPAAASPLPAAPVEEVEGEAAEHRSPARRQDPQDENGSAAVRRAARALRSHRALQHVPYRDGEVTVALAGARGSRALLRVSAPTVPAAKRGWHRFLRRYRDSGRAYVPVFKAAGSERPRGGA